MTFKGRLDSPHTQALGATFLRLGLGAIFLAHSLAKLFIFTMPNMMKFFEAKGFPPLAVYPVAAVELVGGTMLVFGLYTRVVSIALIPIMMGALKVAWPNGWLFSSPGGGWEFIGLVITALVAQICLGDGAFSLGRIIARRREASIAPPR